MRHHVMGLRFSSRAKHAHSPGDGDGRSTRRAAQHAPFSMRHPTDRRLLTAASFTARRAQWQWTATLGPNPRQGRSTWFDRPGPPASYGRRRTPLLYLFPRLGLAQHPTTFSS